MSDIDFDDDNDKDASVIHEIMHAKRLVYVWSIMGVETELAVVICLSYVTNLTKNFTYSINFHTHQLTLANI